MYVKWFFLVIGWLSINSTSFEKGLTIMRKKDIHVIMLDYMYNADT